MSTMKKYDPDGPAQALQPLPPPSDRMNLATPPAMLARALESGAGMDVVEKLLALQERWEANNARRAFNEAIAAAKAEIPVITKNKAGHTGRYATLAQIAETITEILGKHRLGYRFRTHQDDRIHVTCVLFHADGHSEENSLAGPPDTSGQKSSIHAIGSTLTYLQRYTLVQALGLASAEHDDDGHAASKRAGLTAEQAANVRDMLKATQSDEALFLQAMGAASIEEVRDYDRAISKLQQKARALAAKAPAGGK